MLRKKVILYTLNANFYSMNLFPKHHQIGLVSSFSELVKTKFYGNMNALCWERKPKGDFKEIVSKLTLKENITEIFINDLLELNLSEKGNEARKIIIHDIQLFLKPTNWLSYTEKVNPYNELPENLILKSRSNYLTFYFSSICFSNPKEVKYKLKLEGLDDNWTPVIDQHSFTYPNLSYGLYTFKVISSIDGINWSEPAIFKFEILKPYYLTWWFITLNILLLASIVTIIVKWRQNVIKRQRLTEKLMYKSRLLSLEQQTLNASMNRHFIFNALNSIQYYINTQDRLSANKYLTSFAKLIRKNLDSSIANNGMVTLNFNDNSQKEINVYNNLGQLVLSKVSADQNIELNLANQTGVFLVMVSTEKGQQTKKIIIQ